MEQNNIRDFNNDEYSVQEGADLIKELNDRTEHSQDGYNSIAEIGTKLKDLLDALGNTQNLIKSIEKEKITVGANITSIQLSGSSFPKLIEIYEEGTYFQEGDLYTYNPTTGSISFSVTITAGTNIYITKYF